MREYIHLKKKVALVVNLVLSTDVTETRHFIGLVSYYRNFIANLSNIVRPFTDLIRKNIPFNRSPGCQVSSDTTKIGLTKNPVMIFSDLNKQYSLFTGASKCEVIFAITYVGWTLLGFWGIGQY